MNDLLSGDWKHYAVSLFWMLVWAATFYQTVITFSLVFCVLRWKEFNMGKTTKGQFKVTALLWAFLLLFWFN